MKQFRGLWLFVLFMLSLGPISPRVNILTQMFGGGGGDTELPFEPDLLVYPALTLSAADITAAATISGTVALPVTIHNFGSGPAGNVQLSLADDGLFTAEPQQLGEIAPPPTY